MILSRWLPLLVLSEDPVRGSFEIVHLSGLHRPDEGREEEQRQQQGERQSDVHSRHARILQPSAAYIGPRHKEQGSPPTPKKSRLSVGSPCTLHLEPCALYQKVRARYELSTTVMELSGIKMAASSGLMWPVMAKVTATTL